MKLLFLKTNSQPNGFCWGHQCSWTLTPAKGLNKTLFFKDKLKFMYLIFFS